MKQTGVEYLVEQLFPKALSEEQYYHIEKAKAMEKEEKIEFACKVVEVSSEKYIQGKTTRMIAEELNKSE